MQPEEEGDIEDDAYHHGDHVVPRRPGRRDGDDPPLLAPLERDAVIDGVSQKRAEQDDRGKIAIGDEMGKRPGLYWRQGKDVEPGLDPSRHIGRNKEDESRAA